MFNSNNKISLSKTIILLEAQLIKTVMSLAILGLVLWLVFIVTGVAARDEKII